MPNETTMPALQFADLEQQKEAASFGMWIFLATELLVFGALFTGYTVYHYHYPKAFEAASSALNLWFGGINTLVLLASSLTMALAVHQAGNRRTLVVCLVLTALLGTAFLVIKGFEYYVDFEEELVPGLAFNELHWREQGVNPDHVRLFLLLYYFMTGLHAVHLIVGIGLVLILAVLAWRGWFSATYHDPVEVGGLYWHFVDVIWVFLLPLLYLAGTR